MTAPAPPQDVSRAEALRVWTRVALLSFGGPAGQIATMHRIVVDEKRWVGEARFLHALAFCTLLPGPEAQQLATYIGWLLHGVRGGLVAGILFVLPGALAMLALSAIYAAFGQIGPVAALFFGLKCAVLAIVVQAVLRVGRRAIVNRTLAAIAALSFAAIFVGSVPFPAIVLAAGLAGYGLTRAGSGAFQVRAAHGGGEGSALGERLPERGRPYAAAVAAALLWLAPVLALLELLGPHATFTRLALFFSEMAVVTFGGAYAVLAYVAQEAVQHYHWLRPGEMLDGLGLAETTPGPLILVTQFVGFLAAYRDPGALAPLAAGVLGGLLTTWVTFAPCFLWIFAGAPYVERLRGNRALAGALAAITAAVVGVILNLAAWFALHTWFRVLRPTGWGLELPVPGSLDPWAALLSLAAFVAVFRFRAGMIATLAAAAAAGVALRLAGLR